MEILGKLFGSETKVKIMRLFLFSPEKVFSAKTIAQRVKSSSSKVRSELATLNRMSFIKRKKIRKPKGTGYTLNRDFKYLKPLENFLISAQSFPNNDLVKKISRLGSIKLIIISGVFIQNSDTRVDILIVGDNMKRGAMDRLIKGIESEIGKELKYAYFSTEDFKYRLGMFDKLIRDILDYPHKKLLNRLTFL